MIIQKNILHNFIFSVRFNHNNFLIKSRFFCIVFLRTNYELKSHISDSFLVLFCSIYMYYVYINKNWFDSIYCFQYDGLIDVWKQMVLKEGITSLWKGVGPTLAMTIPFAAIQFRLYHLLSALFPKQLSKGESIILFNIFHSSVSIKAFHSKISLLIEFFIIDSSLMNFVGITQSAFSGALAGVCAKLIVYPMDVLKKRMQIREAESVRQNLGKVLTELNFVSFLLLSIFQVSIYRNTWDCIVKLTRQEGMIGWYKGLCPSLLKSAAFSGFVFMFYEISCLAIVFTHRKSDKTWYTSY